MQQNILLLGGGGFIGQALASRFVAAGHAVTIVARHLPEQALPGTTWRQGALEDVSLLKELLPRSSAVFHLATTSTPGSYRDDPAREMQENLFPLLRLLEVMATYPELPLIYLSSGGAIYGNPTTLPVSESHPATPLSYHAAGKAAAEQFLSVFARSERTVTILRPSNAYGPGQPFKRGFGVVRALLENLKRDTPMEIWGDGETVRDYLFIDDLSQACLRALENPTTGTFNLGSGVGHSLNEICRLTQEITGKPLNIHYRPARGVDVKAVVLDSTAFRQLFDWQPRVTLEQGISRTWRWLLDQP
jgi:UDP-glucose 4-epimerase